MATIDEYRGVDEIIAPPDEHAESTSSHPCSQGSFGRRASENEFQDNGDEARQESIGLDELEAAPPDENPDENNVYRRSSLEKQRSQDRSSSQRGRKPPTRASRIEGFWSSFYTHSYLVFFSILGVLSRLGLDALNTYPGAPLSTTVVWANVGGSLIMGYLREERMLFRRHWNEALKQSREAARSSDSSDEDPSYEEAASSAYIKQRSTVHGFIGLTVGFCGTFTSFADIIRDAFLALSNDLDTAPFSMQVTQNIPQIRNNGYSTLAVIGVVWIEVSMSLAALILGGHIGVATHRLTDRLPTFSVERITDRIVVVFGWGAWLGAVLMAIWPPRNEWRGQAVFAVLFAPLGAMLRFHLAKQLNPKISSFPLGTFAANVVGTCILGMIWDLQHSQVANLLISCQILQGVGDGFCGALTTVSTWVLELKSLRLKHAYVYGFASLTTTFAFMITIMGSLRWTLGFEEPSCAA